METLFVIVIGLFTGVVSGAVLMLFIDEQRLNGFRQRLLTLGHRKEFLRDAVDLEGEWHLRDWRDDPGKREKDKKATATEDAVIHHSGNSIRGSFTSRMVKYQFSGTLEENHWFVGTWCEKQKGFVWHGVFMFEIGFRAETMRGRWIGLNKHRQIDHGEWEWKRPWVEKWPSEEDEGQAPAQPSSNAAPTD